MFQNYKVLPGKATSQGFVLALEMRRGMAALRVVMLATLASRHTVQSRSLLPQPRSSTGAQARRDQSKGALCNDVQHFVDLVKRRPTSALGVLVLSALVHAHTRIQLEKRAALKSLRSLGSAASSAYSITIVTTAAMPWKTGTAVNALLRAAALANAGHRVTLCLPWLHPLEQALVFPG